MATHGLATTFGDTGSVGIGGITLGGGGNFGLATRFKFRLHPVDRIVGGVLVLPATPENLAAFVAAAAAAPDELSTIANVLPAPPLPCVPAREHGRLVIMATLVYAGAVVDGERAVAPFRRLAAPLADLVRPMRYVEIFRPGGADVPPPR